MNSTFTIEPATGGGYWSGLADELGAHPWAVALATAGWKVDGRAHHYPGSRGAVLAVTWYVGQRTGAGTRVDTNVKASAVVARFNAPAGKSMADVEPRNPFLSAVTALENLAALRGWIRAGGPVPSVFRAGSGGLLTLRAPAAGGMPVPWVQGQEPVRAVCSIPLAAALITAGFVPFPDPLRSPDGDVGLGFMDDALSPGMLERCLTAGMAALEVSRKNPAGWGPLLNGAMGTADAPGQHPFQVALGAMLNLRAMLMVRTAAEKNPIRVLERTPGSARRALVTNSILEGLTPRDERVKRHLREHLRAG